MAGKGMMGGAGIPPDEMMMEQKNRQEGQQPVMK